MEEYLSLAEHYGLAWIVLAVLGVACIWLVKWILNDYTTRLKELKEEQKEERVKFYSALNECMEMNQKFSESLERLKNIEDEVHTAHEDIKQVLDIVKQ